MEHITIGQIAEAVALLVGLIGGLTFLHVQLKKWVSDLLKDEFKEVNKKLDAVTAGLDEVDLENCKNFLVVILADIEKGNPLDEIEKERFWEEYGHYIDKGGNSYIKTKVERLKAEHKL